MPEQTPSANSLLICYICNLDWAASGLLWAQKKGLPGTLDCFSDPGFPGAGGRTAGKIQSFKLKSRKGHVTRYEERKHSTVSVCLELSFLSASLKRIAEQRYNCLWCGASPGGRGSLALTSSPSRVWELCSTTGKNGARTAALPHAGFLGFIHVLCFISSEDVRGEEKGKCYVSWGNSLIIQQCLKLLNGWQWWEKHRCFPEIACCETRN